MNNACCCGYLPYNVLYRISGEDDLELVQNLLEQRELALEEAIEQEELVPQYEASFLTRASRKLSFGDNKKKKISRSNNVTPDTTPRTDDKKLFLPSSSSIKNSPRDISKVKSDSKIKFISSSFKIINRGKSKDIPRKTKSENPSNSSCSSELDDDSPGRERKFVFTMSKSSSPNISPSKNENVGTIDDKLYVSDPPATNYISSGSDKNNSVFQMEIVETPTYKKKEKRR